MENEKCCTGNCDQGRRCPSQSDRRAPAQEQAKPSDETEGVAGLTPYEFMVEGKSLRWYLKRDVDALLAAHPPASPSTPERSGESGGDLITLPIALVASACYVIRETGKHDSLLAKLRAYTTGEFPRPAASSSAAPSDCPTITEHDRDGKYDRCTRCNSSWPAGASSECQRAYAQLCKAGRTAPTVAAPSKLSKQLRDWGTTRAIAQHYADAMLAAADELDRLAAPTGASQSAGNEAMPASFGKWFADNYPTDTLIHDPEWHAPKIYWRAIHAYLAGATPTKGA